MFETPNGLVFSTKQVMDEGWPIRTVTHDAEDGAWQFVNGFGDTDDAANIVLLHAEHVVELDPSVVDLADLPRGWVAWRRTPQDPWVREPQDAEEGALEEQAASQVSDEEWETFVAHAKEMLTQRQDETFSAFGIETDGQYHWDMDKGEIVFTRDGRREAAATLHYVGAVAQSSGTWMWSWANTSVPEVASRRMLEVRNYGLQHGFKRLIEGEWPAEPDDGRDMTAVAAAVIGADGFFHDHVNDLSAWFLLTDFRR